MKLDGVRVLDLSLFLPGPYLTQAMADHGADVIKVEPPGGEPVRNVGYRAGGQSVWFRNTHRGKRSVVLDLKTDAGREALLRLQEDGLVARRGYRGTVVSDTTPAEAAEMAQIRIKLESVGIRRAAEVLSREEIDELAALIDRAEAASRAEDAYSCSELDRQFHLTIFQASGLIALEPILSRCALHMHRYTFRHPDETKRQHETPVARQHLAVLDALARRDAEAAAIAVRSHIEAVIDLWSPTLRQAMSRGLDRDQSAAK